MTRDDNKRLIERLHAIWNGGDIAAVDEVYAADFVAHLSGSAVDTQHPTKNDNVRNTKSSRLATAPNLLAWLG